MIFAILKNINWIPYLLNGNRKLLIKKDFFRFIRRVLQKNALCFGLKEFKNLMNLDLSEMSENSPMCYRVEARSFASSYHLLLVLRV